jgi:integrase
MSSKKAGRPKGKKMERKDIYADEFKQLINWIEESNMKNLAKSNAIKAFYLLYFFGFRAGEIANLKNSHIYQMQKEHVISLCNNTKTKTPREAYISDRYTSLLEKIFKENLEENENYVLISPIINRMEHYSSAGLIAMLNKVLKKALGEQYTTHSFRAGYITELHNAGVDIKVLSQLIGHRNIATTYIYIKISEQQKRDAVNYRVV